MDPILHVVIVTHNSSDILADCIDRVCRQRIVPDRIIIVDSGSTDAAYLEPYGDDERFRLVLQENIGFSAANNIGLKQVDPDTDFILFMNPDTFLDDDCIATALESFRHRPDTAILTGILKGYDLENKRPSGLIDSTGIFRTWYGRWYDRGQGQEDRGQYDSDHDVPAICGAFMLCRKKALETVSEPGSTPFDERFFMYKEDIDLSLRLRRHGWKLSYDPGIVAFHARGWARERTSIPHGVRSMASKNEIRLNAKNRSPYLVWAVCKYLAVSLLRI